MCIRDRVKRFIISFLTLLFIDWYLASSFTNEYLLYNVSSYTSTYPEFPITESRRFKNLLKLTRTVSLSIYLNESALNSPSVSYTHLDVYKRQLLVKVFVLIFICKLISWFFSLKIIPIVIDFTWSSITSFRKSSCRL